MRKEYKNLVFTDHALERLHLRSLSQDKIFQVVSHPEKKFSTDKSGQFKYILTLKGRKIHVVAKKLPQEKKWLVISVWVRGEDDPVPIAWQIITFPFKIIAKIASIILSYMKYLLLEKKKL